MTIPYERYLATKRAKDLLWKLVDPKQSPRLPQSVRAEARAILKHFPTDLDLERAAETSPEIFSTRF